MNNSLPRLIDGMVATIRQVIVPGLADDFARGQAFGLIYMLNSIGRRATWSNEFLGEQLQALTDLGAELAALAPDLPRPDMAGPASLPSAAELEAARDAGDGRVCDLIEWLSGHRATLDELKAAAIDAALQRYLTRQLKWDMSTSAKPMFEEMSRGADA